MPLSTNVQSLATRVATEFKTVRVTMSGNSSGDLSGLTTSDKSSLVAAINEARNSANIPDASETSKGIVELASAAETAALTDLVRAITPGRIKPLLDAKANTSSLATVATTGNAADLTGVLNTAQLPSLAIHDTFQAANQTAMLALNAQRGDIAARQDNGKLYILTADAPNVLANWMQITATGDVISVNGRTGTVVVTKTDVALGNVDNTSDAAKPVSTAQQTAINGRQPLDATLTALAGLTTAANKMIYATGVDTFTTTDLTSTARTLLAGASASAMRGTLDVYSTGEIGNPETDFVATFNAGLV